jgi:DNA topoisomerase-1
LEDNFPTYISDTFTAEMENELDEIADGTREYVKTLKDFYGPFSKEVKEKDKLDKQTTLGEADDKFKCPKCGGKMIIKLGRGGKFLSCARYPDCDGALTIEGYEIKADEPIGTDPKTGLPIFVKNGRFGPYVQLGEMVKGPKKRISKKKSAETGELSVGVETNTRPRMASIPKEKNPTEVTVEDALLYLSLPRVLGQHPDTGKDIIASKGRFGPYIAHDGDFRSLKKDDVFEITLQRALEILKEEKKKRGFAKKEKK